MCCADTAANVKETVSGLESVRCEQISNCAKMGPGNLINKDEMETEYRKGMNHLYYYIHYYMCMREEEEEEEGELAEATDGRCSSDDVTAVIEIQRCECVCV